jgi:hypothetical protein
MLQDQLSSLAGNLTEANAEADKLSKAAFTEPLTKCVEAFTALSRIDQKKALDAHFLPSPAAAEVMRNAAEVEVAHHLRHMTSSMSAASLAEVLRPLVEALPTSNRLEFLRVSMTESLGRPEAGAVIGRLVNGLSSGGGMSSLCEALLAEVDGARALPDLLRLLGGGTGGATTEKDGPAQGAPSSKVSSAVPSAAAAAASHAAVAAAAAAGGGGTAEAGETAGAGAGAGAGARAAAASKEERDEELVEGKESERAGPAAGPLEEEPSRNILVEEDPLAELGELRRCVMDFEQERVAMAANAKREVAAMKAELARKVKAAAAAVAEAEGKWRGKLESLDGELVSTAAMLARSRAEGSHLTVQLRATNLALEAERKAHATDLSEARRGQHALQARLRILERENEGCAAALAAVGAESSEAVAAQKRRSAEAAARLEEESRKLTASLESQKARIMAMGGAPARDSEAGQLAPQPPPPQLAQLEVSQAAAHAIISASASEAARERAEAAEAAERALSAAKALEVELRAQLEAVVKGRDAAVASAEKALRKVEAAEAATASELEAERKRLGAEHAMVVERLNNAHAEENSAVASKVQEAVEAERERLQRLFDAALAEAVAKGEADVAACEASSAAERSRGTAQSPVALAQSPRLASPRSVFL